jgi:hypothetical protein
MEAEAESLSAMPRGMPSLSLGEQSKRPFDALEDTEVYDGAGHKRFRVAEIHSQAWNGHVAPNTY